jgi:hypothetical protein
MSLADDWDSMPAPTASSGNLADEWDSMKDAKAKPAPSKAALGSDAENFWAGAGKAVVDIGRGAKQLIDVPAKWLESKFPGLSEWSQSKVGMPSAAKSAAATDADVTESRARDAPLMDTKAGMGGNVTGNILTTMVPLGVLAKTGTPGAAALFNPTTYKAAAVSGALQGAVQPVAEGESRLANTGAGAVAGVAGNAAVNTVGRVAQPITKVLSAAHEKAVNVLENAGVPLDAAQRTGSAFLNRVRSSFSDNPFTVGPQAELAGEQKAAFSRAVLKTIGEDATAATPEVMQRAEKRINGVFKDVLDRNSVTVKDAALARIGQVQAAANEEEKRGVSAIANRIIGAVGDDGKIAGQAAYNIKKDLDRLASSPDSSLAYHARQLRSTLMDAINDSLPAADREAFSEARQQFANMKRIEPTIDREGSGAISAPKLANVMAQKANRAASIYGKGDQQLVDLAHAGNMLIPDKLGNSGTPARIAMQVAAPLILGAGEGARSYAYDPDRSMTDAITHGATTIGALAVGPRVAQRIMNNPATARYMASGMGGSFTPLRDLLLLPQTNATVGGISRRLPVALEERQRP